jgi:dihydroorotate dehydrogenase (fumarate)
MDLSTTYLGLSLRITRSSCRPRPSARSWNSIRKLEDSGAAAIVLHSLFEEQIAFQSQELNATSSRGSSPAPRR